MSHEAKERIKDDFHFGLEELDEWCLLTHHDWRVRMGTYLEGKSSVSFWTC